MPTAGKIRRTYRYRLYPTRRQVESLESQLAFCCDLYNAALEQRRDAWRLRHESRTFVQQTADLTEVRHAGLAPEGMNCWAQQNALRRLDLAFAAFFRRCKAGGKPGYPRFRSKRRYDSLSWSFAGNAGGVTIREGRLALQGVGHVKVKWHRAIPAIAELCTATVTRSCGRWYVGFSLDMPPSEPLGDNRPAVGIDLGVSAFAALSTGELVAGPRCYRSAQRGLRVAQRRTARRKRGGNRRRKTVAIVAQRHEHMRAVRRDFLHKLSRRLAAEFGLVAVEALNIKGLAGGMLAKDVHDQGWSEFLAMLRYKAEGAGTEVIAVDPRRTSQFCSGCGVLVPKDLRCRVHQCPGCGLVLDRDVNAARVILALGLDGAVRRQREARGLCVA